MLIIQIADNKVSLCYTIILRQHRSRHTSTKFDSASCPRSFFLDMV